MPRISESLIDELLDYIDETRESVKRSIRCPFPEHDDDKPSFGLDINKQRFNCLGCHKHGNLLFLYEEILQKQIEINIEVIKSDSHIDVSESSVLPTIDFLKLEEIRQLYLEFINKRKIKKETLDILGQEVCVDKNHKFYGYLCFQHDTDESFLCGRLLLKTDKRSKYMYWKGKKPLLGLSFLDNSLNYCILVEGIFDWFTLVQLGFKNVICMFGTQVSRDELYKLVDRVKTCIVIPDKDYAGFDGAKKISDVLKEFGIKCERVQLPLPFGKDLNEALEKGLDEQIINFINNRINSIVETKRANSFNSDGQFNQVEWLKYMLSPDSPKLKLIKTGIDDFDEILEGGIPPGVVTILGKSSMGKSAFTIFLLAKMKEAQPNLRILYVTYEISMMQVWSRIISINSEHKWFEILKDRSVLSDKDRERAYLLGQDIHVKFNLSINDVIEESQNYDIIAIDYIQVVPKILLAGQHQTDNEFISSQYGSFRTYAEGTDKIFFILSSIDKGSYKFNQQVSVKGAGAGDYSSSMAFEVYKELDKTTGETFLRVFIAKNTTGISNQNYHFLADYAHNNFMEINITTVKKDKQI